LEGNASSITAALPGTVTCVPATSTLPPSAPAGLLTDEELALRWQARRLTADADELLRRHMPMLGALAHRFQGRDHHDDLLQVACLGFMRAIERFDPERGSRLGAYTLPTVLGELRRHLRDRTWAVRVPRGLQERVLAVTRAIDELTARNGRSPTTGQLAQRLNITPEEALEAMEAGTAYHALSLDAPVERDGDAATLNDWLGASDPELERAPEALSLPQLLGTLPVRSRTVLRLRFDEDLTQAEIAERVGCSQMQVSRILRASLRELRERAAEADAAA
jgi:RNA polymerase sigma-B factor